MTVCLYLEDANWPLLEPSVPDGTARVGGPNRDGVAIVAARRRKEATYPKLVGPRWSCWEVKWEAGRLVKHEVS